VLYEVTVPETTARTKPSASAAEMVLQYRRIGQTRDDAAGEAYDKVARLLALGYPGGPVIDQLASHAAARPPANGSGIRFASAKIKGNQYDFSFSGIKTAVLYHVKAHLEFAPEIDLRRQALDRGERKASQLLPLCSAETLQLIASFQRTVVAELAGRSLRAAEEFGARTVLVSGGVAANNELRATFEREAARCGVEVFFPSRELSTDNAAMIAAAAYPKLLAADITDARLNAAPVLPLA